MSELSPEEMEREEIEMLLPWYVTGKLDPGDLAKVESYLAAHPEVARQLDLARAERDQSVAANEALGVPSPRAAAQVMASLSTATPARTAWRALRQLPQRIGALFVAPTASAVRWAAAAVVVIVALQTGVIATLLSERAAIYRTASGTEAGDGISVLVVFTDDATAAAIGQLLADVDGRIVDGPGAGGIYKVRLRMADASQTAREAQIRRLTERRDIVRAVLPGKD